MPIPIVVEPDNIATSMQREHELSAHEARGTITTL
jgi:hypothetical protein